MMSQGWPNFRWDVSAFALCPVLCTVGISTDNTIVRGTCFQFPVPGENDIRLEWSIKGCHGTAAHHPFSSTYPASGAACFLHIWDACVFSPSSPHPLYSVVYGTLYKQSKKYIQISKRWNREVNAIEVNVHLKQPPELRCLNSLIIFSQALPHGSTQLTLPWYSHKREK